MEDINDVRAREARRPSGFDTARPVRSFAGCVWGVMLAPKAFFSGLPEREGAAPPLLFAAISAFVSSFAGLALVAPDGPQETVSLALWALFYAAYAIPSLIVLAVFAHVLFRLLGGKGAAQRRFGDTLRVVCYASATVLLAPIPLLGVLARLYGLYLIVLGLKATAEKHADA